MKDIEVKLHEIYKMFPPIFVLLKNSFTAFNCQEVKLREFKIFVKCNKSFDYNSGNLAFLQTKDHHYGYHGDHCNLYQWKTKLHFYVIISCSVFKCFPDRVSFSKVSPQEKIRSERNTLLQQNAVLYSKLFKSKIYISTYRHIKFLYFGGQ